MTIIEAIDLFESQGQVVKSAHMVKVCVDRYTGACYRIFTKNGVTYVCEPNEFGPYTKSVIRVCELVEKEKGAIVASCDLIEDTVPSSYLPMKFYQCRCQKGEVFLITSTTFEFLNV